MAGESISPHKTSEICDCENCTKIDMLIGDPLLNLWESDFIKSLSQYGWIKDYSDLQAAKLNQVWQKIHRLRKISLTYRKD
jgi:hypothetical protein